MRSSDKEGMVPKGVGLLFFVLLMAPPAWSDDYQAVKGDSLNLLAQRNKVPADVLQRSNPDENWDRLQPGDKLWLPDRYTVKAGDTLYSLCRFWGVDQAAVLALNALGGGGIRVGQVLFIPPKPKAPAATVTVAPVAYWPVEKAPHPEGDKLKSVTFPTSGEPFRSVSAGTVVYLGEFRGVGRVLLVEAADKTVFAYGNFEDATVEFGQTVTKGQPLGVTSSRTSQKLLFFAFRQSEPLDVFSTKR